jgi:hypothetical protein
MKSLIQKTTWGSFFILLMMGAFFFAVGRDAVVTREFGGGRKGGGCAMSGDGAVVMGIIALSFSCLFLFLAAEFLIFRWDDVPRFFARAARRVREFPKRQKEKMQSGSGEFAEQVGLYAGQAQKRRMEKEKREFGGFFERAGMTKDVVEPEPSPDAPPPSGEYQTRRSFLRRKK